MAKKIEILDSDPATGKLVLYPGDFLEAGILATIEWSIKDPKVHSFRIEPKEGTQNIFSFLDPPPSKHVQKGKGSVGLFAFGKVYKYSIFWKNSATSKEYEYDPIISIKPKPGFRKLLKLIFYFIGLLTACFIVAKSLDKNRKK